MSWIGDKAEATANVLKDLLTQTPAAKLYRQGLPNVLDALLNTREEEWRAKVQAMPKPFDSSPEAINRDMEAAMAFWNPAGMVGMTKLVKPTTFYRGTNPGATERIRTGAKDWDSYLFAASNPESAKVYGSSIETIKAKPEAKILMEGSREFMSLGKGINGRNSGLNMLEWADEMARRAKAAGYDAVHFKRQSDIGTPIINEDAFIRNYQNGLAEIMK